MIIHQILRRYSNALISHFANSWMIFLALVSLPGSVPAQTDSHWNLVNNPDERKVKVFFEGKLFTEFIYPDSLEKPVLYPIHAADGAMVTRGFPLMPRSGEPTDHPHHLGLWLNYENVNRLDFWNNSYAIPSDKKNAYGWIRTNKIIELRSGPEAHLSYSANWVDQQKNVLLSERTQFIFSANANERIIDRITTLEAQTNVLLADAKDGFLGLRVAHELELPSAQPKEFRDDKGNVTKVAADPNVNGNYLTSEGKTGDSAWGTRARWCMMYGKINADSISIVIIDHQANPGYPCFWHARGYGLFAANPLGQKIFSNGKMEMNLSLKKGESVSFRYRIVIASGDHILTVTRIDELASRFAREIR